MSIPPPERPDHPEFTAAEARLRELLVDELAGELSADDVAELERLREQFPDAATLAAELAAIQSNLIAQGARGANPLPSHLRSKLLAQGEAIVLSRSTPARRSGGRWTPMLIAASVLLAASAGFFALQWTAQRTHNREQVAALEEARARNADLLAGAQRRVDELTAKIATGEAAQQEMSAKLAEAAAKSVLLAQALDDATRQRDEAQLRIAQLEAPIDPAIASENRRKLLQVPETIRIAWQPFDLPDAPAEQRDVSGDVVWNDKLEQGYLRFVGLKPNDPNVEQYQVWVIDERGMEQKVSGGVFNANAQGEVIVPIHPGIDVRKVALFAITIEEPGGTWVPDLRRRVVVAPRGS